MRIVTPINDGKSNLRRINLYAPNSGLHIYYDFIGSAELREQLSKRILRIGDKQKRQTNLNADMTGWAMQNEEPFATLANLAHLKVSEISDIFFNRPDIEWIIKSCWGVRYKKGDNAFLHDHYPATWSIVYYVLSPKGSSTLQFPGASLTLKPSDGLILIFPGNIEHQVPKSKASSDRIVVSMNFYMKFNNVN